MRFYDTDNTVAQNKGDRASKYGITFLLASSRADHIGDDTSRQTSEQEW